MSALPDGADGLLCFDLDGCLVDSRGPISSCINHALVSSGVAPHDEAALHRYIGPPLLATFTTLLDEAGYDRALAHDCIAAYRERYAEVSLTDTTVVPGVEEVLATLADTRPLVVVTSKPTEAAVPIVRTLGLDRYFIAVYGPTLDALAEAKEVGLRRALAEQGADVAASVWMIGDRHHDIDAGRAVGARTMGVTWGIGDRAELAGAGADVIVDHPVELLDHL